MRLFVFTPTWQIGPRQYAMWPECRRSMEAQQIDGAIEWYVGLENPHPIGDMRNVLHQYQRAQRAFLAGECDAFLALEHDSMLPDAGAVQRMLDSLREWDVVYAPYLLRHGYHMLSTWQYINERNLGMSLSNYPDELRQARESIVWRICGAGFGCTLFGRQVLEALAWTHYGDGKNWCPDLRFAEDALRAGFRSVGRFDVPVAHRAGAQVLHPYGAINVTSYRSRVSLNAILAGRWVRLDVGVVVELSEAEAHEAARMGYIDDADLPAEAKVPLPAPPEVQVPAASRRNRARTLRDD